MIAHNVPLIYVPRFHWNEQDFLLKYLDSKEQTPPALSMTREDFYQGNWGPLLEKAYELGHESKRREQEQEERRGEQEEGGRGMMSRRVGNGTEEVVDVIETILMKNNATTTTSSSARMIRKESP